MIKNLSKQLLADLIQLGSRTTGALGFRRIAYNGRVLLNVLRNVPMVDTNGMDGVLNGEGSRREVELRDQRHGFWLLDSAARSVGGGSGSVGTSGVIRIHILLFEFIVI